MKIKQVEEILGINRETVRYYIREGLISPLQQENKYREYSDEDIERMKQILILRSLGVSIADIRGILGGRLELGKVIADTIESLNRKQSAIDEAIRVCNEIASQKRDGIDMLDTDRYYSGVVNKEETTESI